MSWEGRNLRPAGSGEGGDPRPHRPVEHWGCLGVAVRRSGSVAVGQARSEHVAATLQQPPRFLVMLRGRHGPKQFRRIISRGAESCQQRRELIGIGDLQARGRLYLLQVCEPGGMEGRRVPNLLPRPPRLSLPSAGLHGRLWMSAPCLCRGQSTLQTSLGCCATRCRSAPSYRPKQYAAQASPACRTGSLRIGHPPQCRRATCAKQTTARLPNGDAPDLQRFARRIVVYLQIGILSGRYAWLRGCCKSGQNRPNC